MSKYANAFSQALKYAGANAWNPVNAAQATMHGLNVEKSLRSGSYGKPARRGRVPRRRRALRRVGRGTVSRRTKRRVRRRIGGRTGLRGKQLQAYNVLTKTVPPQVFRFNIASAMYGARGRCNIGSLGLDTVPVFLTGQTYTMNFGIVPEDIAAVYGAASVKPTIGIPVFWGTRTFDYLIMNQQNTVCYMEIWIGTYRRDHYKGDGPATAADLQWRDENEMIALSNWHEGGSSISNPGTGAPEAATPFENKLLVTELSLKKVRAFKFGPGETKRLRFKMNRVFVDNGYIGYQALSIANQLQALRGWTKTLIVKCWGEPGYEISTPSQANNAKISSTRPMFAFQCLKQYTINYSQTPSTILPREIVNNLQGAFTTFGSMTENTPQNVTALL